MTQDHFPPKQLELPSGLAAQGLCMEPSRNVAPLQGAYFSSGRPQAWNTPLLVHLAATSKKLQETPPPKSPAGWTCPIPVHFSHCRGWLQCLVYGNTEFYLRVWPLRIYLSWVSPHSEQGVTKTLALSCKNQAFPSVSPWSFSSQPTGSVRRTLKLGGQRPGL